VPANCGVALDFDRASHVKRPDRKGFTCRETRNAAAQLTFDWPPPAGQGAAGAAGGGPFPPEKS
jgi:hypothetical protein